MSGPFRTPIFALAIAGAVGFGAAPALAVSGLGLQLDGNANSDGGTYDWDDIFNDAISPGDIVGDCEFIVGEFVTETGDLSVAWKGGTKDFEDFDAWWQRDSAASQKSDLLHLGLAAWNCDHDDDAATPDHLILQFMADRRATSGNTFVGFWALQNTLEIDGNRFAGDGHLPNDTLVVTNFPGNVDPATAITEQLAVYAWNPAMADFKGTIEEVLAFGTSNCDGGSNGVACSIVNEGGEASPWPFQSSDSGAPANVHTRASFVEGAVDVSAALGVSDLCIATGLVETRQSSSISSLLDDLVVSSFNTCGINIDVACVGAGQPNYATNQFDYVINGTVSTTRSTIDNVVVEQILPAPPSTIDGDVDGVDTLGVAWGPHGVSSAANPVTVQVRATGSFGSAEIVAVSEQVDCPASSPEGEISITKDCVACIVDLGDTLGVRIRAAGKVTNTGSDVPITGFDIVETAADGSPFIVASFPGDFSDANNKLDPGETVAYAFDYDPSDIPGTDDDIALPETVGTFDDTVELQNITAQFGFTVTGITQATAMCMLCVPGAEVPEGLDCDPAAP